MLYSARPSFSEGFGEPTKPSNDSPSPEILFFFHKIYFNLKAFWRGFEPGHSQSSSFQSLMLYQLSYLGLLISSAINFSSVSCKPFNNEGTTTGEQSRQWINLDPCFCYWWSVNWGCQHLYWQHTHEHSRAFISTTMLVMLHYMSYKIKQNNLFLWN